MQLPRRAELLRGMLGADLLGFQTAAGADNFVRIVARLLGAQVTGNGVGGGEIEVDGRTVLARAFPISIDVGEMRRRSRTSVRFQPQGTAASPHREASPRHHCLALPPFWSGVLGG